MRQLGLHLAIVILGLLGDGRALAQPKICGNQSALGNWNLGECPQLKDDGAGADESAGDGIYSLELSLDPTALLEYKILPQGMWAGALGQQGSHDSGSTGRRGRYVSWIIPNCIHNITDKYGRRSILIMPVRNNY